MVTLPDPEVTLPNPEITCPNPEVTCPHPAVTLPDPEVTHPDPMVTCPDREVTLPDPEVTSPTLRSPTPTPRSPTPTLRSSPDPEVTLLDPEVTRPDPMVTHPNPEVTLPDPEVTLPDPEITCPDPEVTCPEPMVTLPHPEVTRPENEDGGTAVTGPCPQDARHTWRRQLTGEEGAEAGDALLLITSSLSRFLIRFRTRPRWAICWGSLRCPQVLGRRSPDHPPDLASPVSPSCPRGTARSHLEGASTCSLGFQCRVKPPGPAPRGRRASLLRPPSTQTLALRSHSRLP